MKKDATSVFTVSRAMLSILFLRATSTEEGQETEVNEKNKFIVTANVFSALSVMGHKTKPVL